MAESELKRCPTCGSILKVLLFLGVQPDGYVCKRCHTYYAEDLTPLALMIEEEMEDDVPTED
jgi:DNA-directed RNA polymerase subunit RPC12/RpoP